MTVKIDIAVKNLELTDRIKEYVEKKMVKLDRFLSDIDEVDVELAYNKSARSNTDRHTAQITVRGKGYILRTEEHSSDVFPAIDVAADKLQRQIERFKGKRARGRGDGVSAAGVVVPEVTPETEEIEPTIVRRKTFTLVPMNEQEALEQMKLLGHDNFFIFYNADRSAINVLYLRRDGTYGLIDPKLG